MSKANKLKRRVNRERHLLPTVDQIREITDPYGAMEDDCVIMSHLMHHLLADAHIPHKIYHGCDKRMPAIYNVLSDMGVSHHMWIELETKQGLAVVDYMAVEWLGEEFDTPNGVFLKSDYPHIWYRGQRLLKPIYPREVSFHRVDPGKYPWPDQEVIMALEDAALGRDGALHGWQTGSGQKGPLIGDLSAAHMAAFKRLIEQEMPA